MKKYTGKALKAAYTAAAALLLVFCLTDTQAASEAVCSGIRRCLDTVIPSLFAVMVFSSVFAESGAVSLMPAWAGKLSRLLFGMGGEVFPVFTFSMFAGYPVGARLLYEEYSAGRLEKRQAELLAGLCFGAGPAFIFGCISRRLYGTSSPGQLLLISNAAANILLALAVSVFLRRCAPPQTAKRRTCISVDMLTDCVIGSGRTMAGICAMILAFSAVTAFLERTGAVSAAGALIAGFTSLDRKQASQLVAVFLDVTSAGELPRGDWLLLPYISGLTSLGGVCVYCQTAAVSRGRLSMKPFIIIRTAASVISFYVCRLLLPIFMERETMAASALKPCSGTTAVPSVMLVLMTVMLMWEYGGRSGGNQLQAHKNSRKGRRFVHSAKNCESLQKRLDLL